MTHETDPTVAQLVEQIHVELPDSEHGLRCAQFAATLFNGLSGDLGLEPTDRKVAILAAYLHDIGYIRMGRDHHRKSFDVISTMKLPMTEVERTVTACVARYHGTTNPSIEHAGFEDLDFDDLRRVRRLTAINRLAVALDASHLGLVTNVRIDRSQPTIGVVGYAIEEPAIERDRLQMAANSMRTLAGIQIWTDIIVQAEHE